MVLRPYSEGVSERIRKPILRSSPNRSRKQCWATRREANEFTYSLTDPSRTTRGAAFLHFPHKKSAAAHRMCGYRSCGGRSRERGSPVISVILKRLLSEQAPPFRCPSDPEYIPKLPHSCTMRVHFLLILLYHDEAWHLSTGSATSSYSANASDYWGAPCGLDLTYITSRDAVALSALDYKLGSTSGSCRNQALGV